ncbi:hypothetical protein C6A85_11155, partial [Mycobacterium sp. ITM-2017-0098]
MRDPTPEVFHPGIGNAKLKPFARTSLMFTAPRIPTQTREINWYPYSRRKTKLFTGVIRAAAGRGRRRLGL